MAAELAAAVAAAKGSLYFSGARIAEDLERFLAEQGDACRRLGEDLAAVEQVTLVGSGGEAEMRRPDSSHAPLAA